MKSLKDKINESLITEATSHKYCVEWITDEGNFRTTTNDYKKVISDLKGNYKYYEVMDMTKSDFSEPEALIEWSGKDGYWANAYLASTDPENAPEWFTGFKGKKLEKIERCKK